MSIIYNGKSVLAIYRNGTAVEQALIAWNWAPRQLYFGDVKGAAYVPNIGEVYSPTSLASFGENIAAVLDEKNGTPVLGPEMVSFDLTDSSFWNHIGSGVAFINNGDGTLTVQETSGTSYSWVFTDPISIEVGRTYRIETEGLDKYDNTNQNDFYPNQSFIGPITHFKSTFGAVRVGIYLEAGTSRIISTLSVREISGDAALQASTSPRPLLGRAPLVKRNIISTGTHNFSAFIDEVNSEIIANNVMGPDDNPTSASSFQVDNVGGTGQCRWYSGVNFVSAGTFTYSIWLKKGTERYVALLTSGLDSPTSDNLTPTIFDLENGVISSDGEGTGKIVPYTNGWYRCSASFTIVGTDVIGDIRLTVANQSSNGKTINLDGSIVFYGYGPQVERGSTATTYQKVISSLDITEDGVTSYPFIRMDLSDDALTTSGLGSTKNLLRYTEEFDNTAWFKTTSTITPNATISPDGTSTADLLIGSSSADGDTACSVRYGGIFLGNIAPRLVSSVYVKDAGCGYALLRVDNNSTRWVGAVFNFATQTISFSQSFSFLGISASFVSVGNGWYRIILVWEPIGYNFYMRVSTTLEENYLGNGNGTAGIYVWGAQLEIGSAVTDYEYGGFKGTSLVAGRNGAAVESVTLPDGNFTLGPTAVTSGAPGLLRAVGDIVGYNLINKTLTAKERKYLIQYYKDRGAKGMLVYGPELVTNGGFNTDLTDWTVTPDAPGDISWSSGRARFLSDGVLTTNHNNISQMLFLVPGRFYQLSFDIDAVVSSTFNSRALVAGVQVITWSNQFSGTRIIVFAATAASSLLVVEAAAWNTISEVFIDNISVKEIRPEEEWV